MNKHLLTLIFLCISGTSGFAQLGVGLRGGYGVSSTSADLVTGMSRSIGANPTFGLMLNYDLDLHFSAGMEFNYVTLSESLEYDDNFYPDPNTPKKAVKTTPKISYLQMPLFGRVTFGEKKYKAALTFGPYIGIGLNGSWTNGPAPKLGNRYIMLDSNYTDVKFQQGDFKRLDMGGMVGLGGQYQVESSGIIFIEARLQLGFTDFYNKLTEKQRDAFSAPTGKYLKPSSSWRSANITIGYMHTFKLPKKKSSNTVKKAGKQRR